MRPRDDSARRVHRFNIGDELFHVPVMGKIENLRIVFDLKDCQDVFAFSERVFCLELCSGDRESFHIRVIYPGKIPRQN